MVAAVTLAAVPVVFWFSVGTSAAWIADSTAAVPFERRYVPETCAPVSAVMAAAAVVAPVPPFPKGSAPTTPAVKLSWPNVGPVAVFARRGSPVVPALVVASAFVALAYFTPNCVKAVDEPVPPFATDRVPVIWEAGRAKADNVASVAFVVAVTLAAVPVVF